MSKSSRSVDNMKKDYLINYRLKDGRFRVYNEETKEIATMVKLPDSVSKFKMLNVDDKRATDNDLIEYAKSFMQWCIELRFVKGGLSFRYSDVHSDYTAVTRYFNARCDYKNHQNISPIEYKYSEMCMNAGLQYLKKNDYLKTGFGYDFKSQYGLAMNSMEKIPTKQGKEYKLDKIPTELKAGFYRVVITCENESFRKVFAFSSDHCYVRETLKFAIDHKKQFNVKLKLMNDLEYNAYLYEDSDLVTLNSLTDRWFRETQQLKKLYPKNRLVKHLISSAWGHLNAHNKKNLSASEMETMDVGLDMSCEYMMLEYHKFDMKTGKKEYWEVLDTQNPYKYNIRLKPWIAAIARNMTADIVLQDIDNVVRVHTDGIVFKKEMKFDNVNLIPEDKTTGKIHWVNNGCYFNKTTGYKTKGYDTWLSNHSTD